MIMSEKLSDALKGIYDSLTDEQKEKAKKCSTDEEFIKFAGEEGIELPADELERVSGGYYRKPKDYLTTCRRCGAEKMSSDLEYGYCKKCLDEMKAAHITPLL